MQAKSLEEIQTSVQITSETDLQKSFAKKVAQNLFTYLQSFNLSDNQTQGYMQVPVNSLEKWYEKFNKKYDLDPL